MKSELCLRKNYFFVTLLSLFFLTVTKSNAQVANYSFVATTATYNPLSTSTVLFDGTWNDNVGLLSLPFAFTFNGIEYTSCSVNSNGYITFGITQSGATTYFPISQGTAYAGAVAAFGRDLTNNGLAIVYGVTGTSPNREFVIQWNNARRVSVGTRAGNYNFQIHLKETTNQISVVYNSATSTYPTDIPVQIGLRGASATDFNNRTSTTSFSNTTAGAANNNTVVTGNTPAKNPTAGLTFTWSPPTPFSVSPADPSICNGGSTTLTVSSAASYTYTWSPNTGLNTTTGATVVANPATTTTYTITATDGTITTTKRVTVEVNPVPSTVDITNANGAVCPNALQTLTATGGTYTKTAYHEDFGSSPIWTYGGTTTSGLIGAIQNTNYAGGSAAPEGALSYDSSGNGSWYFYPSGVAVKIQNYVSLSFDFKYFFSTFSGAYTRGIYVDVSTDGTNFTNVWSDTPSGTASSSGAPSINLNSYIGNAYLFFRFRYTGDADGLTYWVVDDINISGNYQVPIIWSPNTNLFTNSNCTVAYDGVSHAATLYTKPSGAVTYTATVCSNSDTVSFTMKVPVAITSATAAASTICSGDTTTITANGVAGDNAVVTWYSGAGATGTNYGTGLSLPNAAPGTYYAHVTGDCGTAETSVTVLTGAITTWTGSSWDNNPPTSNMTAVIAANYSGINEDITACSLTVTNNAVATIPTGYDVFLSKGLTVDSGSTFNLSYNSNLVQNTGTTNLNGGSGTVNVFRDTQPLMRLDYVMWGSPVAGQQLQAFSPQTLTNRFYTYDPSIVLTPTVTNPYAVVASPSTTNFADATGYLIRMPNNHPTSATVWSGKFTGIPHSGSYTFTLGNFGANQRFNSIANPYPSTISISSFVAANSSNITGTLYFWRKTNSTTVTPGYCTWAGGTFTGNGQPGATDIGGVLEVGQGFIVEASESGTQAVFNNAMRTGNNTSHLLKNTTIDYNRIWLNITSPANEFSQMAVGYITGATNDVDLFDGKQFSSGPISLNMKINDVLYVIQGKSLPFVDTDVVPLSYKVTNAGNYTIAIDHVDGLFSNGTQDIFIKDNLNNTYTNLNNGSFTFASDAGTFDNRLELVYRSSALSNNNQVAKDIVVFKQNDQIVVEGGNVEISKVEVYDLRGRLVINKKDVNATSTRLQSVAQNQVLIVKVTATDNTTFVKKIVN